MVLNFFSLSPLWFSADPDKRPARGLAGFAAAIYVGCAFALAGCSPVEDTKTMARIFVPDTESMNADRFGDQTFPVFMRPAATPMAMQPLGSSMVKTSTQMRTDGYPTKPVVLGQKETTGFVSEADRYGQMTDHGRMLPSIPADRVDPSFLRQPVDYPTSEKTGTLIVDTKARFLYLVVGQGQALRYGVSIGRAGYAWSGRGIIRRKEKWPRWTPTTDMVKADVDLRQISSERGGMPAGVNNPLGARALYIYQNGKDTLYRVHGTPDWQSIGKEASSGCVRMFNQDVIDLANRVKDGAEIVVM